MRTSGSAITAQASSMRVTTSPIAAAAAGAMALMSNGSSGKGSASSDHSSSSVPISTRSSSRIRRSADHGSKDTIEGWFQSSDQ
jgi:hypothetical protein